MTKTTDADNDTKRRAFLPIQLDLVERLVREADTRTGIAVPISSGQSPQRGRLAA